MNRLGLSVVVPVHERARAFGLTLEALSRQSLDGDRWELVVVDDASGPAVEATIRPFEGRMNLRRLRLDEHRGRAAARNAGIEASRGRLVVLLDADTLPAPDLLERHLAFHRGDDGRVLLGTRYDPSWETLAHLTQAGEPGPPQAPEEDMRTRRGVSAERIAQSPAPWLWAFTHNMSLAREVYESVGGFDTNFSGWGHEDLEFAYRLFVAAGRRRGVFTLDPDLVSFHLPHFSDWSKNSRDARRNLAYLKSKHRCFDVELFRGDHLSTEARVAYYQEVLAEYRSSASAHLPDAVLRTLPPEAGVLVVGARDPRRDGFRPPPTVYDHFRPAGPDNPHLLGLATGLPDRSLDAVVHVDLWRHLLPADLNAVLDEGLRIAGSVDLVATGGRTSPSRRPADVTYVCEMLEQDHAVTRLSLGEATVLRVEPARHDHRSSR